MSIKALIVTELKDQGIKSAQKSFKQLAKSTLGVSLGVAGLTTAFVALGKAGVKAAADDAKAMQRLDSILNNMGFASQTSQVNDFIASLEYTTGTLDDELRPAYQSFLQITKDASAAQALLSTSMDIAAGTGTDLATVSSKLTKAIAGQRKGLVSLGLGITATEAKTMDLNEVIAIANERFGGMAEAVARTPTGQLDRLNAAFANLNETVGYGFMSGLDLTEAKTNRLIQVTNDWAAALGRVFGWAAQLVVKLTDGLDWVLVKFGLLKETANSTASFFATWNTQLEKMINQRIAEIRLQKILKAITDAQLAAERKRLAEEKKRQAEKAKELAAAKALAALQKKFDLERISIYAASKRAITEEERARLTAMMTLNDQQYEQGDATQSQIDKLNEQIAKLDALQLAASKSAATLAAAQALVNGGPFNSATDGVNGLTDALNAAAAAAKNLQTAMAGVSSYSGGAGLSIGGQAVSLAPNATGNITVGGSNVNPTALGDALTAIATGSTVDNTAVAKVVEILANEAATVTGNAIQQALDVSGVSALTNTGAFKALDMATSYAATLSNGVSNPQDLSAAAFRQADAAASAGQAPVTININALSTMDIEEAVAAAVNTGSRAGLAYTQVFSRL